MWPVMTLTLLLQLTDDEQLYAQATPPEPVTTEETQQGADVKEAPAAEWPMAAEQEA